LAQAALLLTLYALAVHVAARRLRLPKVRGQKSGEFCTQPIDRRFESMIKHVSYHNHAARHPLAPTAQFSMLELRHRAFAMDQGAEQGHHCINTDAVALSEFCDLLLSFRGKLSHNEHPLCG
jgi:hypothetical protein